jgi:hypothetical protein
MADKTDFWISQIALKKTLKNTAIMVWLKPPHFLVCPRAEARGYFSMLLRIHFQRFPWYHLLFWDKGIEGFWDCEMGFL